MKLPSSTPTSTSSNPTEICDECGSQDSWVIHSARLRGVLRSFCTHCLLRNHPLSFCPSCLAFYDSSPPHHSRRVSCSKCGSHTHIQCAGEAKSDPFLCPPCLNPNSFSFFRPIVDRDGVRFVDKPLSAAFLCAAKIALFSMNRAVFGAKLEAERKGRECAVAKKRAREALEDVFKLCEKARSVIPKGKEGSFVLSGDQDQKPKQSLELDGDLKVIESSGQLKKQSPAVKVKQEK